MCRSENISYSNISSGCTLDVYLPTGKASSAFVHFHGGGFVEGDKDAAEIFAPYLTERGIAVISANYRIYPTAQYPDYICDAVRAVAWAHKYNA